jgi:hypothetical protein
MEVSGQLHVPATLPPGNNPRYQLDRILVGFRADVDAVVKRKIPILCQESNPSRPSRSVVTILTELFQQKKDSNKLSQILLQ